MAPSQRIRLLREFKLGSCIFIQGPVDRKNLHFSIENISVRTFRGAWEWKLAYVLALIKWVFDLLLRYCLGCLSRQHPGHQFLVYCRRTKEVDNLRDQLIEHGPDGLKCATYHGKNSEERDTEFMEKWEKNYYDVVLATVGSHPSTPLPILQSFPRMHWALVFIRMTVSTYSKMIVHALILRVKSVMLSIGQLLSLWTPTYKNVEELGVMESPLSASSVCICSVMLPNPTNITKSSHH